MPKIHQNIIFHHLPPFPLKICKIPHTTHFGEFPAKFPLNFPLGKNLAQFPFAFSGQTKIPFKKTESEREIIPAAQIYPKMSKLSKISKISKFPKLTKIPNHSCIFFFSCWPLMSQSLWYFGLRLAPLPPAQPLSLSTTGLNVLCAQKFFLTFSSNGGRRGEQMGTLGKNGAWGDATCTCPRTCVSRPCSSLCMVAHVLTLQVWLSTCSMVSGREDLLLHSVGSIFNSG